ncbi:hypothetical protein Ccrd_026170 [Cynara cardunculus var. scolymus]|uniref:DUF7865 domain-containing protein n=1 Tax=Cynara cardunculus var. scolymus TaxID=59895 RepID=A0A103SAX0_CYNCS|nr:hypothetical protein Ccrd_026170 [Cynara cardunculus var. scolymus]
MESSGFFLICLLHLSIAISYGGLIMFYLNEISTFSHGIETARKLSGSMPHDQLLIQTSHSFVGMTRAGSDEGRERGGGSRRNLIVKMAHMEDENLTQSAHQSDFGQSDNLVNKLIVDRVSIADRKPVFKTTTGVDALRGTIESLCARI